MGHFPTGANTAFGATTFFHTDNLGSPVVATDEAGNVLWNEVHLPYGERILKQADVNDYPMQFTGEPEDPDTGMIYLRARYHAPLVGRFYAIDPVSFDAVLPYTFNRYSYGANNPFRYIDPSGASFMDSVAEFGRDVADAWGTAKSHAGMMGESIAENAPNGLKALGAMGQVVAGAGAMAVGAALTASSAVDGPIGAIAGALAIGYGTSTVAGGWGDYVSIFDGVSRDHNYGRQGFESVAVAVGLPEAYARAAWGVIGMTISVVGLTQPLGITTNTSIYGPSALSTHAEVQALTQMSKTELAVEGTLMMDSIRGILNDINTGSNP